ncbi:MAG: hypothetical protein QOD78_1177, partial [Chloroflexota bacterium]|nr:hypothetical protein [Chloroflexota bacterium]
QRVQARPEGTRGRRSCWRSDLTHAPHCATRDSKARSRVAGSLVGTNTGSGIIDVYTGRLTIVG